MIDQFNQGLDSRIAQEVDKRVEIIVNEKMDSVYDVVSDKIWRKKNILFVNVPESTKKQIVDRIDDDMAEIDRILNVLIPFDESMIECKPVRVGKVGPKPRLLRLTLKSEYLVKQIADLARDNNDTINPNEHDKTKKIYINKDFSVDDRMKRKRMIEEKKELERQGIQCDIKRNRLVRRDQNPDFQRQIPRNNQGQNRLESRPTDMQRPVENNRSNDGQRLSNSFDSNRSYRTDPGQQTLYSEQLKFRPQSDSLHSRQQSRFQPHRRHDHRSGQEYSQGPDGDRTGRSPLLRDDLPLNRGHYRPENDSYGRSPLLRDSQYETERRSRNDRYNDEREGAVGGVGSQRRTARTEGRERSRDRNHYYTPRGNARNDFQHG